MFPPFEVVWQGGQGRWYNQLYLGRELQGGGRTATPPCLLYGEMEGQLRCTLLGRLGGACGRVVSVASEMPQVIGHVIVYLVDFPISNTSSDTAGCPVAQVL